MEPQAQDYQFDTVEVRLRTREVLCQGKPVAVEPKAFRVLVYLIQNRDRAVRKDELIEKVWDGAAVSDNALSRIVAQLRKELGDDARQPRYIQTLPTLGYRFVGQIAPTAAPPAAPAPPARRRLPLVLAAGIVVAIGATSAVWLYAIRRPVIVPAPPHPIQITTSPNLDLNGSFSPDDNSLVYSSNRSGHFEIYLRPLDVHARELQVTADGQENIDPAWSPDGSAIAFYSARRAGICIVPALGGTARQIATFGSGPAWSPDGQWIAFESTGIRMLSPLSLHRGSNQSTIWVVARDGSGLRRVTEVAHVNDVLLSGHRGPSWWPDGKRILFNAGGGLSIADVASGKSELLTQPATVYGGGRAVPARDGRSVYYADGNRIFRVPLSGNRRPVQVLDAGTAYPYLLSLSTAGNRLAFSQMAIHSELWQAQPGAEPRPVFQDVGVRVVPQRFSPDGRRVLFTTSPFGGKWEIWIANADGSAATALDAFAPGARASWNADGSAILYLDRGQTEVLRISPGGSRQILFRSGTPFGMGNITPDERSVVYHAGAPLNLWKLSFGSKPVQLTFDPERAGFPALSADGRWIAYAVQHGESSTAAVMDIDGHQQRQLTPEGSVEFPDTWSSDDRRVASATFQDAVWNVTTIDRITGERKVLTHYRDFGSYVRYPTWRPGTEQIVYERTSMTGNVYAIDIPAK